MTAAHWFVPAIGPQATQRASQGLARDGYVRIPEFLESADAEALAAYLREEPAWNLAMRIGARNWDASPQEQETIGLERIEAMATAGRIDDFRYLYDVIRVDNDPSARASRGWIIDRLAQTWSTPAALAVWSRLLGRSDLRGVVMAATRFRPGHFITRHDDDNNGKRVAAFALSLSRGWRAEWGGHLEFLDEQGDIEHGFVPAFNSLVLFHVPREHIVSAVAPFAPVARLTISGWLTVHQPD